MARSKLKALAENYQVPDLSNLNVLSVNINPVFDISRQLIV
ncbi:hypothetical protein [Marinobacter maroccanus]|nr:hypothetical protein [Marinobacter maroccanus]